MKLVLAICVFVMAADGLFGSERFLAGASERSIMATAEMITNPKKTNMTVRLDQTGSPIKTKALALSFGSKPVVLIALDILSLEDPHARIMRERMAKAIGLEPDHIFIMASHTHSTPFLKPLDQPHPFFEWICDQTEQAVREAWQKRRLARWGQDVVFVVGASFNTQVYLPDGRVKMTRDYREGCASGRAIDPRLSIVRIDDEKGCPIAGWVRFSAHPACVIFNAPLSAEYPGYLTETLSEMVAGGAPILFGYGASGDANCIPMFGTEADSRRLGEQMASLAAPVFQQIQTNVPKRFLIGQRHIALPLDPPPSDETLDREIEEVETFLEHLKTHPDLEWAMGINCKKNWPVENKIKHYTPLAQWARWMKEQKKQGRQFPMTWPCEISALIIDDLGMVFYPGEPFTALGLDLAAKSPLKETLLVARTNGSSGYLGTDDDRRRCGYQVYTWVRYFSKDTGNRPLPYALGTADFVVNQCLSLIDELCSKGQ